jgi:hypothetical protein
MRPSSVTFHADPHLPQVRAAQLVGEWRAVDLELRQRAQRSHLAALDELHGEHARGDVVLDGTRHHDAVERLHVVGEQREVARLLPVVELAQQALAEFVEHFRKVLAPAGLGMAVEEGRDLAEHLEILADASLDVGALHLDRDRPAVAQLRAMDLTERGRRDRHVLEHGERLRQAHSTLSWSRASAAM